MNEKTKATPRRRSRKSVSQASAEDYTPPVRVEAEVERPKFQDFNKELAEHQLSKGVRDAPKAKRFFKGDTEQISDTWRLEEAKFIRRKDKSNPQDPEWELRKHKHFFRTFDSSGRKQVKSCAVGGHWHEITWHENANGELVAECGPAIFRKDTTKGLAKRFLRPEDKHTHTMTFMGSDMIRRREYNIDAQKFINAYQAFSAEKPLPKV